MATETGHPDDLAAAPPSPLGEAIENVEEKAEQVKVTKHEKIAHAPEQDVPEGKQIDAAAETKDDEKPYKLTPDESVAPDPDESGPEAATAEKPAEPRQDELVLEAAASEMEGKPRKEQLKVEIVEEKSEEDTDELKPTYVSAITISGDQGEPDTDESVSEAAIREDQIEPELVPEEAASVMEENPDKEQLKLEIDEPKSVNDAYKVIEGQEKRGSDPEEEVESRGQSCVSVVVEEVKPKETLETLLRKEKENQGEVIKAIASESCDKDATQSSAPEEKLEKNAERTEVDMLKKDPEPNEEKALNGAIKNADERKEETPVKTVTKQSNNIIAKVKNSLVKARKAIIAKSPSFKLITTDARG